jgi:small-conductance mechanosensitive channel
MSGLDGRKDLVQLCDRAITKHAVPGTDVSVPRRREGARAFATNLCVMSDRWVTAVVTAGVGLALIAGVRGTLKFAFARYVQRLEERRGREDAASVRTRLGLLLRVVVAFLFVILAWQVLSIFPSTGRVANTVLASGAVLALFAGLAFTVPLGNLGAGILLAFAQPVRIGDRVSVGEVTGTAEQITLIYTVLLNDEERRVFIPNSQMVSSIVVNRSITDRRRTVTVNVPVALSVPLERARSTVLDALQEAPGEGREYAVRVGDIAERVAWLTVIAYAPPNTDVAELAGELRERSVTALSHARFLPA